MPLTHPPIKNSGGPRCTERYVGAERVKMKKKRPVLDSLVEEQGTVGRGTVGRDLNQVPGDKSKDLSGNLERFHRRWCLHWVLKDGRRRILRVRKG